MAEEAAGFDEPDDLRDLLGTGPVAFPEKSEQEFLPWHRPRKQYVRRVQWCRELGFLARDLKLAERELRYLTLPGNDLLDIRHIAETICSPHSVKLRYLGFNSDASQSITEQHAAQFSINRLDCIHPESDIFPGDFRLVGETRSVPWRRVKEVGPFHAINLDLCGGFAGREKRDGIPNYFTALLAILYNQAQSDEDFLLFITTRMDDDNVDVEAKKTLVRLAQNILDTCQMYESAFSAAWGLQDNDSRTVVSECADAGEAFMLGLTQWILARGVSFGLRASVRSFMTYRTGTESGEDDIVSLAIRFAPDPFIQPDPSKLAKTSATPHSQGQKLCEQSAKVPRRVSDRVRVDQILESQAAEFERCVNESSLLLGAAGYDSSSYRNWAFQEGGRATA
ncbi:PP_RS20740 family protein [Streptomyces sp. NPDC055210]